MSMQNNTTYANTGSMPEKASCHQRLPLLPFLLMGSSALVALVMWTIPNLGEFEHNAAQFPLLWQVAGNRWEIVRLVTMVCSPIILALLIGACCWLWYTIKQFVSEATTKEAPRKQSTVNWPVPFPRPVTVSAFRPPILALPETPLLAIHEETHGTTGDSEPDQIQDLQGHILERVPGTAIPASTATMYDPNPGTGLEGKPPVYVTFRLLGKVSMTVQTPDGAVSLPVPLPGNALRVRLLVYIAWQQGRKVYRDKLLKDVFGHGKSAEEATSKKLADAFNSHRKLIRADLRTTIAKLNEHVGYEAVPPALDIFANGQRNWWLANCCRVADLEAVEAYHRIIEQAENSGQLANSVPEYVRDACASLIAASTGNFLENLLKNYPRVFDPWHKSWVRKPFTLYRDYLLDALWYLAGYELRAAQMLEGKPGQESLEQQNWHYDCAARYYHTYAMNACNSRFDLKASFNRVGREHGERVTMSERALRRCLMVYGAMGSTHMVDKVDKEYIKLMRYVSADAWEPDQETLADLEAARSRTNAYRLSTQVATSAPPPVPLETAERS